MSAEAVLMVVERVGIPVAVLAACAFLMWRLGGKLLAALVESYRERIRSLECDRDHFRDRSEAAEDRTGELCRELIDEGRGRAHGAADVRPERALAAPRE